MYARLMPSAGGIGLLSPAFPSLCPGALGQRGPGSFPGIVQSGGKTQVHTDPESYLQTGPPGNANIKYGVVGGSPVK